MVNLEKETYQREGGIYRGRDNEKYLLSLFLHLLLSFEYIKAGKRKKEDYYTPIFSKKKSIQTQERRKNDFRQFITEKRKMLLSSLSPAQPLFFSFFSLVHSWRGKRKQIPMVSTRTSWSSIERIRVSARWIVTDPENGFRISQITESIEPEIRKSGRRSIELYCIQHDRSNNNTQTTRQKRKEVKDRDRLEDDHSFSCSHERINASSKG